jgi:hypothetical protein
MTDTKDGFYLMVAKDIMVAFADKIEIAAKSPEGYGEALGVTFNILAREIKKADLDLKKVKDQ